jgi:uncharacterized protein YyaL (SSP411 family)
LQSTQAGLFEDKTRGGYFTTSIGDTNLLLRMKEDYDGAEPAANSVTVMNLLRLAQMTDSKAWRESAEAALKSYAERLHKEPGSMPEMLAAVDFSLSKPKEIVIAGDPRAEDTKELLKTVHALYLPDKILLLADGADGQRFLESNLEFLKELKPLEGKATAYICEDYACRLPTSDVNVVRQQLESPKSKRP